MGSAVIMYSDTHSVGKNNVRLMLDFRQASCSSIRSYIALHFQSIEVKDSWRRIEKTAKHSHRSQSSEMWRIAELG